MTEQAVENKIVQKWRAIPFKITWWGYDSIQIDDPDGNELLFPIEGNSPSKVA